MVIQYFQVEQNGKIVGIKLSRLEVEDGIPYNSGTTYYIAGESDLDNEVITNINFEKFAELAKIHNLLASLPSASPSQPS